MYKEIVAKPLYRPLPKKLDYFHVKQIIFRLQKRQVIAEQHNGYRVRDSEYEIK